MLENLTGTKLKKTLLGVFFGNPKRSFSIDELQHTAGAGARLTADVVREFVRAELVEAASRKGKRFYRINSYYPFYDELRDLAAPGRARGGDFVARKLRAIANLRLAVLSGIFTFQPQLPVDILLVGEGVRPEKLERALSEIEQLVGHEVNYALMERAEYDDRRFMSDRLIRDVLDHPHLVVLNHLRK